MACVWLGGEPPLLIRQGFGVTDLEGYLVWI